MIFCIADVLTPDELLTVRALADRGTFVDGRATAGASAAAAKHNEQLVCDDVARAEIERIVSAALDRNDLFAAASLPRATTSLLVSRSGPGMGYGQHIDNALMGSPPVRTDLSFTVFLNEPEDYDGGVLVIEDAEGGHEIKLPAGSAVLYRASTLHQVMPVERGVRLVTVGWVQSLIRDPRVREMIFDLTMARRLLADSDAAGETKGEALGLLAKVHSNLLRQFVEI